MLVPMRNLLKDADRERLVAPLRGPLLREARLGGTLYRGLAAGEAATALPAEANARAAELLLMPGIRERDPALSDDVLDLVMAMAEAPVPCRNLMAGEGVELVSDDPRGFEVLTPFWRFSGDLGAGAVLQQPRGGGAVLRHTGHLVEFRLDRFSACLDVEEAIIAQAVERTAEGVVLRHVSRLRARGGWLFGRTVEAGTLEYRYLIGAGPVLRLAVTLTAARPISRLRLTTALDGLDEGGLAPSAGLLEGASGWVEARPPDGPAAVAHWALAGPVPHLAMGQAGWPDGAPAVHLRPGAPNSVTRVTVQAGQDGAVRWILLRHAVEDLDAGGSATVTEERLLATARPEALADAMAGAGDPAMAGLDLDPVPPSGAALQAVGTALWLDAAGAWAAPMSETRRAALRGFASRQTARIEAAELGVEGLAQALLGADSLRRAGMAEAASLMTRLLARLLTTVPEPLPLPARSLAALALARAATWPGLDEAAPALVRLLRPMTVAEDSPGLEVEGRAVVPLAQAEALALLARAAAAAMLAPELGARVPPDFAAHAGALHRMAIALLHPLVRPRGGMLEVIARGGLNPAVQAAVTLAFLVPERLIGACQPVAA